MIGWTKREHSEFLLQAHSVTRAQTRGKVECPLFPLDEIKKGDSFHTTWPAGYNLGKLGDELDKLCPKDPFKKMWLGLVISGIAATEARAKQ